MFKFLRLAKEYRKAFALVVKELERADAGMKGVHLFYLENGRVPQGSEAVHAAYIQDPRPWRKIPKTRLKASLAAYLMARNTVYGPAKSSPVAKGLAAREAAEKELGR